ncbi:MAG: fused MFS/spermidine synthase [Legionellaceae bacterium]|nr:fused MFS/spermidine synthase [Legionellaceae bacterium]
MLLTLFIILLLEGFITISVEIITIRQLTPFFGSSVVITSIIIGIFLLFLALGYWRGGMYRQPQVFKQLCRNFTLAFIWIGIGLNYSFIAILFYLSAAFTTLPILLNLSLYLLFILAPIVYWLGQTIPLTTHLFNQTLGVSDISGRALFLSTMGSFLGAICTSLLLFQYLGVAWTIVLNCALLFSLIIFLQLKSHLSWWFLFCLAIGLVLIKTLNVNIDKMQFVKTNNYANYEILTPNKTEKILRINHSNSSLITTNKGAFPYIEFIHDVLFNTLQLHHKHLLVIGAGGFTLSELGTADNDITYVDIDPDIKQIAETYFLNASIKGHFIGQDARAYLNQTQKHFDAIISDAYSNEATIPASLLTIEYFKALADHLKTDGLLVVNIINDPLFRTDYGRKVYNTIHAVFPYCALIPVNWHQPDNSLANMIYVCRKSTDDNTVYKDDLTTATLDFFKDHRR